MADANSTPAQPNGEAAFIGTDQPHKPADDREEIYFKGSTTLDNGLTVGARIELEGQTSAKDMQAESEKAAEDEAETEVAMSYTDLYAGAAPIVPKEEAPEEAAAPGAQPPARKGPQGESAEDNDRPRAANEPAKQPV